MHRCLTKFKLEGHILSTSSISANVSAPCCIVKAFKDYGLECRHSKIQTNKWHNHIFFGCCFGKLIKYQHDSNEFKAPLHTDLKDLIADFTLPHCLFLHNCLLIIIKIDKAQSYHRFL